MIPRYKTYYTSTLTFEILEQSSLPTTCFNFKIKVLEKISSKNFFQVHFYLNTLLKSSINLPLQMSFVLRTAWFNFLEVILCCLMKHNFNLFQPSLKSDFLFSPPLSKKLVAVSSFIRVKFNSVLLPCLKLNSILTICY